MFPREAKKEAIKRIEELAEKLLNTHEEEDEVSIPCSEFCEFRRRNLLSLWERVGGSV